MPRILSDPPRAALLPTAERVPTANLRKAEPNDVGRAILRAQKLRGWSLKEFAAAAGRGERQLARWISGKEHPQLDTLFAIVSYRQPLIIALAECAGVGVDVQMVVTLKPPLEVAA